MRRRLTILVVSALVVLTLVLVAAWPTKKASFSLSLRVVGYTNGPAGSRLGILVVSNVNDRGLMIFRAIPERRASGTWSEAEIWFTNRPGFSLGPKMNQEYWMCEWPRLFAAHEQRTLYTHVPVDEEVWRLAVAGGIEPTLQERGCAILWDFWNRHLAFFAGPPPRKLYTWTTLETNYSAEFRIPPRAQQVGREKDR